MADLKEIDDFLAEWTVDPINGKPAFIEYQEILAASPDNILDFNKRPGISYSLRAKNKKQVNRDLFALVDVVDDDPENRWLSVCFYADMVTDPEELGDYVPQGLFGEDAVCFNLDDDNKVIREYIAERLKEAVKKAAA